MTPRARFLGLALAVWACLPEPAVAQACPPLAPGDSVRVTRTFWTPRPEFQIETRSQRIEFGEVERLTPDSIRYRVGEESRGAPLVDSVSLARRCRVHPGNDISVGRHLLGGALLGAGAGLVVGLCGTSSFDEAMEACDSSDDRNVAALMGIGLAVGTVVGLVVGIARRQGPEWEWIDGSGHPEIGPQLSFTARPGPFGGQWVWGFRVSIRH